MSNFHLDSFEVVSYRGINGLSIPKLTRVNLVTGINGIGKSALLEAMWLFSRRYDYSQLLWSENLHRSPSLNLDPLASLSRDRQIEFHGSEGGKLHSFKVHIENSVNQYKKIKPKFARQQATPAMATSLVGQVEIELDGNKTEVKNSNFHEVNFDEGTILCPVLEPVSNRPNSVIMTGNRLRPQLNSEVLSTYSDLVKQKQKSALVEAVNLVLPEIKDLDILTDNHGDAYLSAITDDNEKIPIQDLGGGIAQIVLWFLNLFRSRGGIFFSDEMENGLHHSILENLWSHARRCITKWDVQFVATTHSDECIQAAIDAFEDNKSELSVHALFRNQKTGKVGVVTYSGNLLQGARNINLDLR